MADTLLPFAESTYWEIEKRFDCSLFHPFPIMELLSTAKEYNDWMARSADSELASYIENIDNGANYAAYLQPFFKTITVKKSSWINIGLLLSTFRTYLESEKNLDEEKFDTSLLKLADDHVEYKNLMGSKIIFCEGTEAMHNPYWKHLPFIPAKGEVLTIKANMTLEHILNRKIYILPAGKDLFKAGSTYTWNFENEFPTNEAKEFLTAQLRSILKIPFEIVDHQAAIRPTVKNRRPFLGLHPVYSQIGILNGLGTKGCLLAPYFASRLADLLSGENDLPAEVDIAQYKT